MKLFKKNPSSFSKTAWLTALAVIFGALVIGSAARACRDCPFPSKISDGRWLLPDGNLQLEIDADQTGKDDLDEVHVILRDAKTGNIVADGVSLQHSWRKTVTVDMKDAKGHTIKGYVHFLDTKKDKIETKFTCATCSTAVRSMLERL